MVSMIHRFIFSQLLDQTERSVKQFVIIYSLISKLNFENVRLRATIIMFVRPSLFTIMNITK